MNLHTRIDGPSIERVRHELKRRSLEVASVTRLSPGMLRIVFSGDDLADFSSLAPDDHVKLFVPTASGDDERRDYTPRCFDRAARSLTIDFAVHDAGPATRWALDAKPGDRLSIGGPKGSAVISLDVQRWVLIGDETALPAIGRRIEEARAGVRITSIVAVGNSEDQQCFKTRADLTTLWIHRPVSSGDDPSSILQAVRTLDLSPDTFVWIAAESRVARAIRTAVVDVKGHPLSWTKTAGYWVKGRADAHEKF